jgi:hypothetical protein
MRWKTLIQVGLVCAGVIALGGILYFFAITLATSSLFDYVPPDAIGPGYPP